MTNDVISLGEGGLLKIMVDDGGGGLAEDDVIIYYAI